MLLDAVDEGLLMLGESAKNAMYFHLEKIVSLKRDGIPDNLEAFTEGLEKIFGAGAQVIEKAIMKSLCRRLGVRHSEDYRDFVESINQVKIAAKAKSQT